MSATASPAGNQPTPPAASNTLSAATTLGGAEHKPAPVIHLSPAHALVSGAVFDVGNKTRDGIGTTTLTVTTNPDGSYKWSGSGEVPAPAAKTAT